MCSLYVTYSYYLSSFNIYISTVPQHLQILATPLHTCILEECPEISALKDLQSKQEGAFLKVPIKSVIVVGNLGQAPVACSYHASRCQLLGRHGLLGFAINCSSHL